MKTFCYLRAFLLVCFFNLFTISCTDIEYLSNTVVNSELISIDSPLYTSISNVVKPPTNPLETIVCLDFIYPFEILIYDANKNIVGKKTMTGDLVFSAFLGNIPTNQNISISYPIKTTLANGTVFTINSNTELKVAIDSCSREDIIAYCNGLFGGSTKCVWKVDFDDFINNRYSSGMFDANSDNTISFFYKDMIYTGTWTFVFVNDELCLNISLAGTSSVAQFWSFNKKISFSESSMIILDQSKNIKLTQICEETTVFIVGQNGPAGGLVFYDKAFYSQGWRYMESALTDLKDMERGYTNSLIPDANQTAIGKGSVKSIDISNFHDAFANFYNNPLICNASNNGTVAAKKTLTQSILNKKDWFLPSEQELQLMYTNLKVANIGNFSNDKYWSSTQINSNHMITIDF